MLFASGHNLNLFVAASFNHFICTEMPVDFVVFKFVERVYSFEFILFHIEERRNIYLKHFSWNSLAARKSILEKSRSEFYTF